MHHPELAWLPFLAALLVAFIAGVAFARINQRQRWPGAPPPVRRGGLLELYGLYGSNVILSVVLVALLLMTVAVLLVAAAVLHHVLR